MSTAERLITGGDSPFCSLVSLLASDHFSANLGVQNRPLTVQLELMANHPTRELTDLVFRVVTRKRSVTHRQARFYAGGAHDCAHRGVKVVQAVLYPQAAHQTSFPLGLPQPPPDGDSRVVSRHELFQCRSLDVSPSFSLSVSCPSSCANCSGCARPLA